MKRFITIFLGVALAASLIIACATPGAQRQTGVFRGSAVGYVGTMIVEVEVNRGNIRRIDVVQHNETPILSDVAFQRVISAVVNEGNLNVDNVTGATFTTMALRTAITEALTSAGIDTGAMMRPRQRPVGGQTIYKQADVIVIGGGGAGLAAAVSAAQNGSSVIVLEKLAFLGGCTLISGSGFNAVNPRIQMAENPPIYDSIDLHFQQTWDAGDRRADPAIVRVMVENALDAIYWLTDLGLEWDQRVKMIPGGLHRRANTPTLPLGIGFIEVYQRFIDRVGSNVEVLLETRATELITEGGRVVGVKATNADNNTVVVRANNGVVMATGGYSANVEMRMYFDRQWGGILDRRVLNTNLPGSMGDGIVMGQAIGANLVGMEYTQLVPFGHPGTGAPSGLIGGSVEDTLYINLEGRRFINENSRRDDLTLAAFDQTDTVLIVVMDSRTLPTGYEYNIFNETHNFMVEYGHAFRADTLEELAVLIGVPVNAFLQTIMDFNAAVDAGRCEFGRTDFRGRIETPPFLAGPRVPTVHHTMGGLQIDTYARVIHKNGNVIPGFYAAGEVAGGVHGTNRVGGNALTDITVFGRIAGESAALRR
ncbi:MAG: flavocytochrome c [Defluviitaleaceae bacterium]|nr:flavocytochrome c [Defluviitaleaceae bacterium]